MVSCCHVFRYVLCNRLGLCILYVVLNFFCKIKFDFKVVNYKLLALHCILSHIIFKQLLYVYLRLKQYRLKSYIISNKSCKFFRTYFTQTFKPCYLRFAP